jgi:orotidine-5'-phosphate decarboxylase
MDHIQLHQEIIRKKSFLCVGLDTHLEKLPDHLPKTLEGILTFNMAIIEATQNYAVAYKVNTAFYEQYGPEGWEVMEKTLELIPANCFTIADAKRGDIGNTSSMYAKAFFERLNFDSITLSPYMGSDSIKPFLYPGKTLIVLALTSNAGADDFQFFPSHETPLYTEVLESVQKWIPQDQLMFVTGATRAETLADIRKSVPDHFLLVPGVGKQGGSLSDVCKFGMNAHVGLIVNSSRGIIFASSGLDFAEAAKSEAMKLQNQMETELRRLNKIP